MYGRFHAAARSFAKLIEYGQKKGEFQEGDAMLMAEHIVIFLEGLKLSGKIIDISDDFLGKQVDILSQLVIKK